MKHYAAIMAAFLVICVLSVNSYPFEEYEAIPPKISVRERRSPEKGKFEFEANDGRDDYGNRDKHFEGRYSRKWGKEDGPQFEVEAHYRRNFGHNQPSEQHGVRGKITIPIGDD